MLRLLSLLFAGAFFSCEKGNMPSPHTTISTNEDTAYSYLALGDSYTIGQSVNINESYPLQTTQLLLNDGIKFSSPEIIAQTGWTTADLINRINNKPPFKNSYDIVTLLIGVNNQYQGLSQTQYAEQFGTLLSIAIQFAGNNNKRVIVLSIPDYSVTPYANGYDKSKIAAEIDTFNAINKKISVDAGVKYLDITPSTRMAATDPSLITYDGLHPSGKEYAKWAQGLAVLIKEAIK